MLLDAMKKDSGVGVVPFDTFGDANGVEWTATDPKNSVQGRLFVDNGTVVVVYVAGPLDQASSIKTTVETLASAQDYLLPSNL